MIRAIEDRRSIRKFKDVPVPRHSIEEVLRAGCLAPSSKNRQPWKFIVVSGASKDEMTDVMCAGIEREKTEPFLPGSAAYIGGAEYTLNVMRQAPVTIFVMNILGSDLCRQLTAEERVSELCNAQSIGAAIQSMTLAAVDLGLGTLWICDIYFAFKELSEWLGAEGELCAALSLWDTRTSSPRRGPGKPWPKSPNGGSNPRLCAGSATSLPSSY